MKTIPKSKAAPRLAGAGLPLLAALSLTLVAPLLADEAAPRKDHALFAGATVRVENGPGFYEIVGVKGYSVALLGDGKLLHIRRDAIRNVRIERSLKLTDVIARIDQMTVKATSVGPHADRFADMRMQMLMSDMAVDAQESMESGGAGIAAFSGQAAAGQATSGQGPTSAQVVAASAPYVAASNNEVSLRSAVASFGHEPAPAGDNALDIGCELSTPRVMHDTYALVLTEFRESGGTPGYNVHIEPLGDLGPKPRRVAFTQTGFPPGFIPGQVSVHLYSGSLELATNLSEGRVDLTADDAMRYLVIAYVASHAKESLPAQPLRIALPADFRQRAPADDLNRTFYVTVGEDGVVRGLSAKPDHLVAVNPYIDSAVRKFRYEPALKDGRPVASVVEMRLASFLR